MGTLIAVYGGLFMIGFVFTSVPLMTHLSMAKPKIYTVVVRITLWIVIPSMVIVFGLMVFGFLKLYGAV